LSSVLVKPLERLPEQTLGRVFYSPAFLFLALALLKTGVVSQEGSNLGLDAWWFISVTSPSWGYLVALQTLHPGRCFLRIRGEGVS
jgi:hypothetical protein